MAAALVQSSPFTYLSLNLPSKVKNHAQSSLCSRKGRTTQYDLRPKQHNKDTTKCRTATLKTQSHIVTRMHPNKTRWNPTHKSYQFGCSLTRPRQTFGTIIKRTDPIASLVNSTISTLQQANCLRESGHVLFWLTNFLAIKSRIRGQIYSLEYYLQDYWSKATLAISLHIKYPAGGAYQGLRQIDNRR